MPLPPPPSGESFSAKDNPGALIAIKALRVDHNYPDAFNKNEGRPVTAVFLDVWVLADGRDAGRFFSDVPNSSRLGRQFQSALGELHYGRVTPEKVGAGTSYILTEPRPGDERYIEPHRAQHAAEAGQRSRPPVQHNYQNEPAYQQPYGQPQPPQGYQQPPAQPYQPQPGYQPPQSPNGATQPQGAPQHAPQPAYAQPAQPAQPAPQGYQPQQYGTPPPPPPGPDEPPF